MELTANRIEIAMDINTVVRCLGCRNRFSVASLTLLEDGSLLCPRCAEHTETVVGPTGAVVELVG